MTVTVRGLLCQINFGVFVSVPALAGTRKISKLYALSSGTFFPDGANLNCSRNRPKLIGKINSAFLLGGALK